MKQEFSSAYNPQDVEKKIYELWEKSSFFNPDNLPGIRSEKFSMVLPPPNVTGTLHIGHALTVTIEDILVRYQRMRGKKTLWIPGTDHAAIATETKFLKEKKISRNDYKNNRHEFINQVNEFALQNQETIIKQLRSMGASLDWSRLAFTLDKKRILAVRTAFKQFYDAGLISRKERVVNWDVKGQTVVSDDEVEHVKRQTKLYTFRYSKDFPISISTTRPETKVGDTAVAVHPNDPNYKQYIGQEFKDINFCGVLISIKIVADESVDKDFGTGAVGVTPSHSKIDEEIADRHNLARPQVINEFAKMLVDGKDLIKEKTSVAVARDVVVQWLKDENLLEKEEEIEHNFPVSQRSGGNIEYLPKRQQCFVLVNQPIINRGGKTLKELLREVVASKRVTIIPGYFEKTYFHWVDNLHDWNISRQVWYGHQIPIWYCDNKENKDCYESRHVKPIVSIEDPTTCPRCGGPKIYQESDTLDTWFSSGLWTFSTLRWPAKTEDLKNYHPTDVLETGYDILFFWVARMILMSSFLLDEVPFHTVYLHGLVRDAERRKMSKSLGNVVDPLMMTQKYGTDALRMSLIFNTAPGTDLALSDDKVKGMKHFANKLWNIARYVLAATEENDASFSIHSKPKAQTEADKDILIKLEDMIGNVTKNLETFQLHEAGQDIYQFVWHEFADKYIEVSKKQLTNEKFTESTRHILGHVLVSVLKLLHPFMPFITEEIWSKLPGKKNLLMVEIWPTD